MKIQLGDWPYWFTGAAVVDGSGNEIALASIASREDDEFAEIAGDQRLWELLKSCAELDFPEEEFCAANNAIVEYLSRAAGLRSFAEISEFRESRKKTQIASHNAASWDK